MTPRPAIEDAKLAVEQWIGLRITLQKSWGGGVDGGIRMGTRIEIGDCGWGTNEIRSSDAFATSRPWSVSYCN